MNKEQNEGNTEPRTAFRNAPTSIKGEKQVFSFSAPDKLHSLSKAKVPESVLTNSYSCQESQEGLQHVTQMLIATGNPGETQLSEFISILWHRMKPNSKWFQVWHLRAQI